MPRHGEPGGKRGRRLWLTPHVRLAEIAECAHRRLEILLTVKEIGAERREPLDDFANATGRNQARQIARRLVPLGIGEWDSAAWVGDGEEAALRCNTIGVKVDGVPHDRAPIRSPIARMGVARRVPCAAHGGGDRCAIGVGRVVYDRPAVGRTPRDDAL